MADKELNEMEIEEVSVADASSDEKKPEKKSGKKTKKKG